MTNMTFTKGIGTPAFMAPEVLNRKKYKKSADVYSIAITMLECITWQEAYPKSMYRFAWDIADAVASGKRPHSINTIEYKELKEIIEKSWKQEPSERLTIDNIVALLETELLNIK